MYNTYYNKFFKMSKTLAQFKQKITSDKLLQTTYYRVSFSQLPPNVTDLDKPNGGDSFDIYCQSAGLPGKTLENIELKKRGFTLNMPNIVKFSGDWSVKVLTNLNLKHYKLLMQWQNYYSDLRAGTGGNRGFPSAQAVVTLLDNNFNENTKAGKMVIFGIYPTEVPELQMDQEKSEYLTADVKFKYSYTSELVVGNGDPLA